MITGSITIFDRTQNSAEQEKISAALPRSEFQRLVRTDVQGLHVGDNQSSSEALIDSESFNVVISGRRYSKLAANYVQFGNYQMRRTSDGGMSFKLV